MFSKLLFFRETNMVSRKCLYLASQANNVYFICDEAKMYMPWVGKP